MTEAVSPTHTLTHDALRAAVVADTQRWLERAVIGLNLCPFAKAPHAKGQVHYAVCLADGPEALLLQLQDELATLAEAAPDERETTLLIAPRQMADFLAPIRDALYLPFKI